MSLNPDPGLGAWIPLRIVALTAHTWRAVSAAGQTQLQVLNSEGLNES